MSGGKDGMRDVEDEEEREHWGHGCEEFWDLIKSVYMALLKYEVKKAWIIRCSRFRILQWDWKYNVRQTCFPMMNGMYGLIGRTSVLRMRRTSDNQPDSIPLAKSMRTVSQL